MIDKVSSVSSEEAIFLDKAQSLLLNTPVCPMFTHKPLFCRIGSHEFVMHIKLYKAQ